MMRLEGPSARRLRRQLAQRRRWETALLALLFGHWAYHKNREWNALVNDLTFAAPDPDFWDFASLAAAEAPQHIDLADRAQAQTPAR